MFSVDAATATSTTLTPLRTSSSVDLVDHPVPASPTSTDGWGDVDNVLDEHDSDKEGWDDMEPLEDSKPSPVLANIHAAQKRPVSQPKSALPQAKPAGSFPPLILHSIKYEYNPCIWCCKIFSC